MFSCIENNSFPVDIEFIDTHEMMSVLECCKSEYYNHWVLLPPNMHLILSMMSRYACDAGLSGYSSKKLTP